jgi:hypothetical protein
VDDRLHFLAALILDRNTSISSYPPLIQQCLSIRQAYSFLNSYLHDNKNRNKIIFYIICAVNPSCRARIIEILLDRFCSNKSVSIAVLSLTDNCQEGELATLLLDGMQYHTHPDFAYALSLLQPSTAILAKIESLIAKGVLHNLCKESRAWLEEFISKAKKGAGLYIAHVKLTTNKVLPNASE